MKNAWMTAAGATVLVLCLTGCEGIARNDLSTSKLAPDTPTTNIETVVVTWQPRARTAEFLGAWRPKN